MSPLRPMIIAWRTRLTASGMLIKNRSMLGSVIRTGPPFSICFMNSGTTLPWLFNTLPKRTMIKRVWLYSEKDLRYSSATRLVAPMTLLGFTALSVEMAMNE
ncbi:MAG: hypothetical protein BWY83_03383 [bacterium ADurb.Bin478]|nr:MAG: hypothetical protein BWY83_03383 [bacterium ADurb.Bin478]